MFLTTSYQLSLLLTEKNLTLATAESCTGGLLAAYLTDVPGASSWFDCALVTYSNHAKQNLLKVSSQTLKNDGAISRNCALEMLQGLLKTSSATVGIAITGLAGPSGGSPKTPLGTVHFALGLREATAFTYQEIFSGDRESIRKQACHFALIKLIDLIKIL